MKRLFNSSRTFRRLSGAALALALTPCLPACSSKDGMVEIVASAAFGTAKFSIDSYEGSLKDTKKTVNGNKETVKAASSRPARPPETGVTYVQAQQYCKDAGKRLCTTKEWKAACSGAQNVPTGGTILSACNVSTNASTGGAGVRNTGAGKDCTTGGAQVFDMIGNVSEWTTGSYNGETIGIAMGPNFGTSKVYLNCSYIASLDLSKTTSDTGVTYEPTNDRIGFRCCR